MRRRSEPPKRQNAQTPAAEVTTAERNKKMLDYEILGYQVQFWVKGAACFFERAFSTEEAAALFVREHRDNWSDYRLLKTEAAII